MLGEAQKEKYVAKLREQSALPWTEALKALIAEVYQDAYAEGARKAYREGFTEAQRQAFIHATEALKQASSDFERRRVSYSEAPRRVLCGDSPGA